MTSPFLHQIAFWGGMIFMVYLSLTLRQQAEKGTGLSHLAQNKNTKKEIIYEYRFIIEKVIVKRYI